MDWLTEKKLGVGKYGVKIVKVTLAMAPFSDKDRLKNEKLCKKTVDELTEILRGE